jgi:hypothetical protein
LAFAFIGHMQMLPETQLISAMITKIFLLSNPSESICITLQDRFFENIRFPRNTLDQLESGFCLEILASASLNPFPPSRGFEAY